jgi:hypothetical protein
MSEPEITQDTEDVEGHRVSSVREAPGVSSEDDTEGHGRTRDTDDDVEGHGTVKNRY